MAEWGRVRPVDVLTSALVDLALASTVPNSADGELPTPLFGSSGWIRTTDNLINSQAFYP